MLLKMRKRPRRAPKGSQKQAEVSQKGTKESQKEPRGGKREPQGSQSGAKGQPKCIRKSIFGKDLGKGAKRVDPRKFRRTILGGIFHKTCHRKFIQNSINKKHEI